MRVIAHVDMDAFYTQVEIGRDPDRLAGQPVVVIQYNPFGDLSTLRPDEDRIKPESNGSIIAVSYEARKYGVKRNMMAQQAKKLCSTLQIVQVPVAHGKADLTIYRDAGAAVINVLSKSAICERASIDEAYLDVTAAAQQVLADARKRSMSSSSFGDLGAAGGTVAAAQAEAAAGAAAAAAAQAAGAAAEQGIEGGLLHAAQQEQQGEPVERLDGLEGSGFALPVAESFDGWHVAGVDPGGSDAVRNWWCRPGEAWDQSDTLLAAGALVVARARAAVKRTLGYSCSAGIAHSKILAKLGSGLHKPAQQTVVPAAAVAGLLAPLPVSKLRQLGGKFGEEVMAKLNVATVGELAATPIQRLEAALGVQDAAWLHRLAQGKDGEEVKPRTLPKSISCGKTFRGVNVLTGLTAVHKWLLELGQELQERIEADRQQHQRLPKLLTVSFDSAPLDSAAEGGAPTAPAGAESANSKGSNGGSGPSHGRLNAQNWRAGATNISRSCALRHARADAIATDALGLVKKWARDRPNGFRIVTMFVSASNFSLAPTGASTLDRFFSAPATAAAAGGGSAGAPRQVAFADIEQQQQQQQGGATAQSSAAGKAGAVKRPAIGRAGSGRASKAARTDMQHGSLRQFLATAPAQTAAAGGASGLALAAAGSAEGWQVGATTAAEHAGAFSELSENLDWGGAAGADSGGDNAGVVAIDGVDGDSQGGIAVWDSEDALEGSTADVDAYVDGIDSRINGAQAAAAAAWDCDLAAVKAAAAAVHTAAAAGVAADGQATGMQVAPQAAPPAVLQHKQARASPVRSALSVLQYMQPLRAGHGLSAPSAAGAAFGQSAGHPQVPAAPNTAVDGTLGQSAQYAQPATVRMGAAAQSSSPAWASEQADELPGGLQEGSGPTQQLPSLHAWLAPGQQQFAEASAATEQAQDEQRAQQQKTGVAVCAEGQLPVGHAAEGGVSPAQQQQGFGQQQGPRAHAPSQCADQHMDQQQDDQPVFAQQSMHDAHGQAGMQETSHALQDVQDDAGQTLICLQEVQLSNAHAEGQSAQHPNQQQGGDEQSAQAVQPAQAVVGSAAWAQQPMQLSDVDPEVLAALPWDIQIEVQQQLRGRTGSRPSGMQAGRSGRGAGRGGAGRRSQQQQQQQQGSIFKWLKK